MKQQIVTSIRKILPRPLVKMVEYSYRKLRAKIIAFRYGNPARALKVIAVTGTNGKTTTVQYMNEILKEAGHKTAMFSTSTIEIAGQREANESHMTVGSVAQMQQFFAKAKKAKVNYVVMEFASHAIDQHKLDGVPILMAIMTNLTQDHLDYHGTMKNYAAVKAKLFALQPKYIVLNRDDSWFDYYNNYSASDQKITYGQHEDAETRIEYIKMYRKGSEANILIDHQTKLELATALPGEFNVYNMTAAVAGAYLLGVSIDDITEGVANLEAVPGRYEYVANNRGHDIVVDYAHTPDGLEKLLQSARKLTKNRVILVFGATGDRDKDKRPTMGEIAAEYADRIMLTDEENYTEDAAGIRADVYKGIEAARGEPKTLELADRRAAIEKALSIATKGDTVLITGLGHQTSRIVDGTSIQWSEVAVIKDILDKNPRQPRPAPLIKTDAQNEDSEEVKPAETDSVSTNTDDESGNSDEPSN